MMECKMTVAKIWTITEKTLKCECCDSITWCLAANDKIRWVTFHTNTSVAYRAGKHSSMPIVIRPGNFCGKVVRNYHSPHAKRKARSFRWNLALYVSDSRSCTRELAWFRRITHLKTSIVFRSWPPIFPSFVLNSTQHRILNSIRNIQCKKQSNVDRNQI